jgi:hypothetical protein
MRAGAKDVYSYSSSAARIFQRLPQEVDPEKITRF